MNVDVYRYLMTVAKVRNITKAAAQLHISQPALTKAIHRQEKELGVTLFDRSVQPLTLTYAGERYFESVSKLLDIDTELREEMRNIARGTRERIRIGVSVERGTTWLPKILPHFAVSFPDVDVQVKEGVNAFFERALLSNQLDLCISTLPILSSDIACEVVNKAPVYVISSAEHPLAARADLRSNSLYCPQYIEPELLNDERFLTLTPAQGMYRVAQHLLEKYGLRVNTVLQLTSQRTITMLAAAGMGLAFTTYNGALQAQNESDSQPVFYTIEDPPHCRIDIIAWKKNRVFTPVVKSLIALTKRVMRSSPHPKIEIRR